MIRSSSFLRPMLQLALLAALLMAFAPTVTRWVGSAGTQVMAGWTELCSTDGIKWVDTRIESPVGKQAPAPAGMPMGADCAYCVLAMALPLLLLCIALLFPRAAGGIVARVVPFPPVRRLRLRGLGGQGPPILL
ncbi:DUF2946 family protein [Pseudoxanthomonas sp. PXM01]|uniref:DUF2946 family protein n=1 Tax=Pseudoxanthomonas sp. PXM01 TaxID=2769295 RepID=UPI001784757B|nr:DUF2946 family protein [Pseudoxanthomonas sp. PXM01]